jgi:hypothetical protein
MCDVPVTANVDYAPRLQPAVSQRLALALKLRQPQSQSSETSVRRCRPANHNPTTEPKNRSRRPTMRHP